MGSANDGIAFPVADLGSGFNVLGTLADGPSTDDLTPPVTATGIALFAFLLAAQLLVKAATVILPFLT
ncbi:hypothetical protein B0G85_1773 [Polynucleobacter brandtiae]|uniref:Uncharacterized protein n=1 Tax=Polynucleobacter brandtiae TaxID=1938816 RepID=A0A2M8VJJ7_9BURK|nr:hypothetical protein B0G85_1773 [Polynucleobacter brandtiae]